MFFVFTASFAQPYFEWANRQGGTDYDLGTSVAVDSAGNVYNCGFFMGTADFDPGSGTFNMNATGFADMFVSKSDKNGDFLWAVQVGGLGNEVPIALITDRSGNVYITGYFEGGFDFDPGMGSYPMTSFGNYDIFVLKLDTDGNFKWARQMGGSLNDLGYGIAVDTAGNVYTTGGFEGSCDFDPGSGTAILSTSGNYNFFISKLDANGNYVWAKKFAGASENWGSSVHIDPTGNVLAAGYFFGTADFNPGSGTFNMTSAGSSDAYVLKLDAGGNFIWARQMGGSLNDVGNSVATDPSGNVYSTGYFYDIADFNPGSGTFNLSSAGNEDIFVSKLDASGNFIWAKSMGGGIDDYAFSIAVDHQGSAYTAGYFNSIADFDPGNGTHNLYTSGGKDIFISKLYSNGNFAWVKQIGGTGFDNRAYSVKVDAQRNVYTTGYFNDTSDFDLNGQNPYRLVSQGSLDIFVQKMSQCLRTYSNINMLACNSYSSPSGKYIWNAGGTYYDTIPNADGCDSIITIDLVIKNSSTSFTALSACKQYTSPSGKYVWTTSNTYKDTISNTWGCDSVINITLTIQTVNTAFNRSGDTLIALADPATYAWLDCNNNMQALAGQNVRKFLITQSGSYALMVTQNLCTDTSACLDVSPLRLNELYTAVSMYIYPNPGSGYYKIRIQVPVENAYLKISDMQGKTVIEQSLLSGSEWPLDLHALDNGIYLLELNDGMRMKQVQFIKQ